METETIERLHKFEKAGLGKAPFEFIDIWQGPSKGLLAARPEAYYRAVEMAPKTTNPLGHGACHFCGTYIIIHCLIEGANGSRFFVGSDCVEKTGDQGLIGKVQAKISQIQKARRRELDQQKIEEFASLMRTPKVRDILEKIPHPNAHFASRGKTLLNWADFMRRASGVAGTKKGLRIVKKAIAS